MGARASSGGASLPSGPPARTRWGRKAGADDGGQLVEVVADQGDLLGRGEVEVEGPQQVGEGVGVLGCRLGEEAEDALGLLLVGALAGQRREAEEAERGGGVAGGDRVVADLLAAGDQLLVVVGGREEAAALGVAEAGDRSSSARARASLEPARLEGRFVEGEQRLEQEGVVLEVGVEAGAAVLVGAQQAALGVAHRSRTNSAQRAGGVEVVLAAEHRAGLGQGGDHQRVPGGEALVVEAGPDPLGAGLVAALGGPRRARAGSAALGAARPGGGCCAPSKLPRSVTP